MKVVKKSKDGMIHLDVTASTSEVSEALNNAGMQFCSQMGIRPERDKTPAQAAAEQLGIRDLDSIVAQQAVELLVPRAIDKHKLIPAYIPQAQPKSMIRRGRTFQFELDVMPKPHYELSSYDPVSFTVEPYQEDTEMIDREIAKMAEMFTEYVADEPHPIRKGDNCLLRIEASQHGENLPGLTTEGRTYLVGEGYMPEGFDEGIMGMEVGEVRTFQFQGPALDESGNEIMETFDATVELKEVQKPVAPVINDEWIAAKMPMYKNLEDLRSKIGSAADEQRRRAYEDYKRNFASSELAKRFEGSIPDEIYEGSRADIVKRLHMQVQSQGMTWEQFVEQQGGEQQVSMFVMLETRQQLVQGFSLDAYYRHFGLSFTDADINDVCEAINPQNPMLVRQQMEAAGMSYALRESAERLCAAKHLVANADISVREPEE